MMRSEELKAMYRGPIDRVLSQLETDGNAAAERAYHLLEGAEAGEDVGEDLMKEACLGFARAVACYRFAGERYPAVTRVLGLDARSQQLRAMAAAHLAGAGPRPSTRDFAAERAAQFIAENSGSPAVPVSEILTDPKRASTRRPKLKVAR